MKVSPKVSEVVIWQNGNVMAFKENGRQVPECQIGCILNEELVKKLNEYCDETTKFYMAVFDEDTYTRRYEMNVDWWFKKKKEEGENKR